VRSSVHRSCVLPSGPRVILAIIMICTDAFGSATADVGGNPAFGQVHTACLCKPWYNLIQEVSGDLAVVVCACESILGMLCCSEIS
jgi:hypothetical protein